MGFINCKHLLSQASCVVAEILLEVTLATFFLASRDLFVVALCALVGFAWDCSSVLGNSFFL